MTNNALVVRLVKLSPASRAHRVRQQLRGVACIAGGVAALLLAAGTVMATLTDGVTAGWVAGVALLAFGAGALWFGLRALPTLVDRGPDVGSRDALPIAFTVVDGIVRFPALAGVPEEDWPLRETRVRVFSFRTGESLQLSRKGCRTRRYGGVTLSSSPAVIAPRMARGMTS